MRLCTYQGKDGPRLGAFVNGALIDLSDSYLASGATTPMPADMISLLAAGDDGLAMAAAAIEHAQNHPDDPAIDPDAVQLLPPVLNPTKVLALGRNYAAHAREGGAEPPDFPMLFHKSSTSLLGAGGTIRIPPVTDKVDFEGELAVIIGRPCKAVTEAEAMAYVAGYAVANDVTARDWQRRTTQFTAGKMVDTFGPLGPALVTADEVPDPGNLKIRTILNGEMMQDGHTSMMIFSVPFLISYISQVATLQPGDVILTGTPEGVGFARKPPVFMQEGDSVTVEIEGVGTLTNSVANG